MLDNQNQDHLAQNRCRRGTKRSKRSAWLLFLTSVVTFGALSSHPLRANAQEYEGCFMRDGNGNVVNLTTSVCNLEPLGKGTGKGDQTKGNVFTVPIKRREANIPVIEVTFNKGRKFEMMVDTGASMTKVTEEMALVLGLQPDQTVKTQVANGDIAEFPSAVVNSIEVGGVIVQNIRVTIGPVPLLGQNFFGDYDLTIKKDEIEFKKRDA